MTMLTSIKFHHSDLSGRSYWLYKCKCGEFKIIRKNSVDSGSTKSCGCQRFLAQSKKVTTHGESAATGNTKEYRCWTGMKRRCYNPNASNFHSYGKKGIKICDRWLNSFESFLADMGRAPGPEYSIDRIDNDGNYELGNCRWATNTQQSRNLSCNKLTIEDARRIRQLYLWNSFDMNAIADIYNVSQTLISHIILNKTWKEN